jgi:hypothetical protein
VTRKSDTLDAGGFLDGFHNGFLLAPSLISKGECVRLADALDTSGATRNARHLIDQPDVQALIASPSIANFIVSLKQR